METIQTIQNTQSTNPHEQGIDTLYALQTRSRDALSEVGNDGTSRCEDSIRYLDELYRKKFSWAPDALVRSMSVAHYDEAVALDKEEEDEDDLKITDLSHVVNIR